jgi:hypothetical protein
MIFSKIDGTTSESFRVGKDGAQVTTKNNMLTIIEIDNTERSIGVSNIRASMDATFGNNDIPSIGAVRELVTKKIRTIERSQLGTIDLDETDYVFVEKEGGN